MIENAFRKSFKLANSECLRWFPGHMNKGLRQMQQKLRVVDCLVEVHDARIPFSGRNADFKNTIIGGLKPTILVMNKVDMIDFDLVSEIKNKLAQSGSCHVVFTNCKDHKCTGIDKLFPLAQDLIANSDRFNRTSEPDFNVMVIGVPNVGKSSLINALRNRFLRKGGGAPTGAKAGITRSVMNKIKISESPRFYLFDTPGILTPNVTGADVGLRLALCGTLQDHLVGQVILADYLLYIMNRYSRFSYVDKFKLQEPTDNIFELLAHICTMENRMLKIKDSTNCYTLKPDFDTAAKVMVKCFRNGEFGKLMLDQDLLHTCTRNS